MSRETPEENKVPNNPMAKYGKIGQAGLAQAEELDNNIENDDQKQAQRRQALLGGDEKKFVVHRAGNS